MILSNYPLGNLIEGLLLLEIIYNTPKIEKQCTSLKSAKNFFGGNSLLAEKLLSRINALQQSETIKDIIKQPAFRFHSLENTGRRKLNGYFAIDVKTKKEPWRIVIEPLDENKKPYNPCNIDEISHQVRIIKLLEVSKHYE